MKRSLQRLPWAGLLGIGLMLAAQHWLLGVSGPWQWLQERISPRQHLEFGIANDRIAVAKSLADDPRRRIFVVGSSRANAGFRPHTVSAKERPEAMLLQLAHGGVKVFELRSMADELAKLRPQTVIMFLSEFDIGSPLQAVPHGSFGSWPAVIDLVSELGPGKSWQHRTALLRLSLEATLRGYRYRQVLQQGWLQTRHRFEFGERFPQRAGAALRWNLVAGEDPRPISTAQRDRILEEALASMGREGPASRLRGGYGHIHQITRGPHVEINRRLMRQALQALVDAGIKVWIVEPPLHPIADQIYDVSIRQDFLAFAAQLQQELEIGFLPIEATGPFDDAKKFSDLTHLNRDGGRQLTQAIFAALEGRQPAPPSEPAVPTTGAERE